jgi:hypothetical protein
VGEEPGQQLAPGFPEERRSRVGDRCCTHVAYNCTRITYSDPGGGTSRGPAGLEAGTGRAGGSRRRPSRRSGSILGEPEFFQLRFGEEAEAKPSGQTGGISTVGWNPGDIR